MEGALLDKMDIKNIYIAHQNTSSLDEIQRMCLGYLNNHPMVLEGQSGIGKNHAINVLAQTFGKKEYRVRCNERMLTRDILGGDSLIAEKSYNENVDPGSEFNKDNITYAMHEGDFLILDGFHQLQSKVQKTINSSLEKTQIVDGINGRYATNVKKRFGVFITYNPESNVQHHDLEPVVKDKCKIIHFDPIDSHLKTYLAMINTDNLSLYDIVHNNVLEIRGIALEDDKPRFARFDGNTWMDIYNKHPIINRNIFAYAFMDTHNESTPNLSDNNIMDLYFITNSIIRTLDDLETLRTKGTRPFARKFPDYNLCHVNSLNITPSSPKIIHQLIEEYIQLKKMDVPDIDISSDIVLSIIDHSVSDRGRKDYIGRNITVAGFVQQICANNGLFTAHTVDNIKKRVSEVTLRGAVNAFIEEGFTENTAEDLVKWYILKGSSNNSKFRRDEDGNIIDLPF
jgi:hypothetical protein